MLELAILGSAKFPFTIIPNVDFFVEEVVQAQLEVVRLIPHFHHATLIEDRIEHGAVYFHIVGVDAVIVSIVAKDVKLRIAMIE